MSSNISSHDDRRFRASKNCSKDLKVRYSILYWSLGKRMNRRIFQPRLQLCAIEPKNLPDDPTTNTNHNTAIGSTMTELTPKKSNPTNSRTGNHAKGTPQPQASLWWVCIELQSSSTAWTYHVAARGERYVARKAHLGPISRRTSVNGPVTPMVGLQGVPSDGQCSNSVLRSWVNAPTS